MFAPPADAPRTQLRADLEADWELWLSTLLHEYASAPFGPHHREFWEWLWAIEADGDTVPFVGVWARGGAKSTSAETGCVALGCRGRRRYGLYVSETQDQADGHVENIGTILESAQIANVYPEMSDRAVGKYGSSKGWRRNRLHTRSGFIIDAIGLDKGTRGLKVEEQRPDFIVLDDIDDHEDTAAAIERKVGLITKRILPAGSQNVVVLAIQNLVHPAGVFARLAGVAPDDDIPSDFLVGRRLSGPVPALRDAAFERDAAGDYKIVAGEPTWAGQSVAACQRFVDTFGLTAFKSEAQHEVEAPSGGMYHDDLWCYATWDQLQAAGGLVRASVWVDPAVTNTDRSDCQAIQCDGLGVDGRLYRLFSWEQRSSPRQAIKKAFSVARRFGATKIGVETDQGGDTWRDTFEMAWQELLADPSEGWPAGQPRPEFDESKAGAGAGPKAERSARMLADYERPGRRIVHVTTIPEGAAGTHVVLERGLKRFPKTKPFDLADAAYWSWDELLNHQPPMPAPIVSLTGTSKWGSV